MQKNRVRPTILLPIWKVMSYSLGYISAFCGEKAAMTCTVAIEETISEHYQRQIDILKKYDIKDEIFLNNIIKIREEEIEHQNTGIEGDAEQAPLYRVASRIVKTGCKFAIFLSKRI